MRSLTLFAVLSFAVSGCYLTHGLDFAPPVIMASDAGVMPVGDAGMMMVTPDASPTPIDTGPVVLADAGPDAHDPPMEDAGSDAGPPPEPDAGPSEPDAGSPRTLVFEAYEMPLPTAIVAGAHTWNYNAQYRVGPGETIVGLDVYLDGDSADVSLTGVFGYEGRFYGSVTTFPRGEDTMLHIELDEPFVTPMDASGYLLIATSNPAVVSGATASGETIGWPRSGDHFRVGVGGVDHFIGSEHRHTAFDPIWSNEFVIRRAVPRFMAWWPSTLTVANGVAQTLHDFEMWAYRSSAIVPELPAQVSFRRLGMRIDISSVAGRVCNLQIMRDGIALNRGMDYSIRNRFVGGPEDPDLCWDSSWGDLIIGFTPEQVLTNAGSRYQVVGTPEGFVAGDSITTYLDTSHESETLTGYIGSLGYYDMMIDTAPWSLPTVGVLPGPLNADLIWSDLSEELHDDGSRGTASSRDWIGGHHLNLFNDDWSRATTLTR